MSVYSKVRADVESFQQLFSFKTDDASKGRACMLLSSMMSSIIVALSGGAFYTGFLLQNDIDLTGVGIISFIPYLASLISFVAPSIMERFEKRKGILAILRTSYWILNMFALTLLPTLVTDPGARIFWICVISFISSGLSFLTNSGLTAWHVVFIPDKVRSAYFLMTSLVTNVFSGIMMLLSGIIADMVAVSGNQLFFITLLRYICLVLGVIEVITLISPKEYPYAKTDQRPKLRDVILIPIRNKIFFKTSIIYTLYTFICNLVSSVLNAYLLSSIGVSYTVINVLSASYALFLIMFSSYWKRRIDQNGWLNTLASSLLYLAPTYIIYMFVTPENYLWLFVLLRIAQLFISVGQNTTSSNLLFMNLPEEDRTNYVSFHTLNTNMTLFLSMMVGTGFVSLVGDRSLTIGPFSFTSVPLLLGITAVGFVFLYFYIRSQADRLEPKK